MTPRKLSKMGGARLAIALMLPVAPCGLPDELAAQNSTRPTGFIQTRYASHTALGLYTGVGIGGFVVMTGMLQNPRSDYHAAIAGVGLPMRAANASAFVAAAAKYESHGWFAQLYVMPEIRHGDVLVAANVIANAPLEREGSWSLSVDRAVGLLQAHERLAIGLAYTAVVAQDVRTVQAGGPAVRVQLTPAMRVEVLAFLPSASAERDVRAVARVSF